MAVTAAITAVVASAATAGYQSKRGHDQQVNARHEMDREKARQAALQKDSDDKEKANKDLASQQLLLRRQRALAMTAQNRYGGTIRTSPLGVPTPPRTGGATVLGAA